ncbi:MAG: VWA domain-containing protein [Maribacter sp.]|nr:VWA domain-containing protein [Maribacter sp.]
MQIQTVFLIITAAIAAFGIVFFQYYFKTKKRGRLFVTLSFLRFLSLFGLFLLLINPKFLKKEFSLEKPNLVLLVDNSSSVGPSKEEVLESLETLEGDNDIKSQFNLKEYLFGSSLKVFDSISFDDKYTNIAQALSAVKNIYERSNNTAIVLVTDGNQTIGKDYEFYGNKFGIPVYPIVLGDTTRYEDVRIDQVNVNRYAFLKNKFPLEVFVSYGGSRPVTSTFSILMDDKIVYRENLNFSPNENSKVINTLLEAGSVGAKTIQLIMAPLQNERNTANNQKNVVIEVIDEKTKVLLVSDILHPDIGALTKAIQSNEQRTISLKKPPLVPNDFEDVDLVILYQPNAKFKTVYDYLAKNKTNVLTIAGTQSDWRFLNNAQVRWQVESNYPVQEVFPILNTAFSKFDVSSFSFEGYPPLESDAAGIQIKGPFETLLNMQIKGVEVPDPLLVLITEENDREAVLFGEGIWKWRMQNYRDNQDFRNFDDFFGKLVLYLTTTKSKNRLQVDYKSLYEGSTNAKISVTYFDEGFQFNPNATILLKLNNTESGFSKEFPMLLKGNYYEQDLSALSPGTYDFTVTVKNENRSSSGNFTILDFDVEQQFLSSDYKKLRALATETSGILYFPSQTETLIKNVTNDPRYRPIQSSKEIIVSLIDFRIILGFIVAALALEWFIRKYNGLI